MSNHKTNMPKPVKLGCKPLVMCDIVPVDKPGWKELFDYGMETGVKINQHGQSKDPALLQEILERIQERSSSPPRGQWHIHTRRAPRPARLV